MAVLKQLLSILILVFLLGVHAFPWLVDVAGVAVLLVAVGERLLRKKVRFDLPWLAGPLLMLMAVTVVVGWWRPDVKPWLGELSEARYLAYALGLYWAMCAVWTGPRERFGIYAWIALIQVSGLLGLAAWFGAASALTAVWPVDGVVLAASLLAAGPALSAYSTPFFAAVFALVGMAGAFASMSKAGWLAISLGALSYLCIERRPIVKWAVFTTGVAVILGLHLNDEFYTQSMTSLNATGVFFKGLKIGYVNSLSELGQSQPWAARAVFASVACLVVTNALSIWVAVSLRFNPWGWGLALAQTYLLVMRIFEPHVFASKLNAISVFLLAMTWALDKATKVRVKDEYASRGAHVR